MAGEALPRSDFYVYEHWRPDKGTCFYVGKGRGDRARNFRRKNHHASVLKKLGSLGLAAEVRIIASNLTETDAFSIEIDRIAFWRSNGVRLCNQTDGGEGSSGAIASEATREKNRQHAKRLWQIASHRERMTKLRTGTKVSPEVIEKYCAAQRKRFQSEAALAQVSEHCRKIAAARRGKPGRPMSPEHRVKLGLMRKGSVASEETRAKQRSAKLGKTRKKFTEETIAKMRLAATKREAAKRSATQ